MATSWRSIAVLVATLMAAMVLDVASDDTRATIEVTLDFATVLREAAALGERVPGAVEDAGEHAAHAVQQIAAALQPNDFVRIPSRDFRCECEERFTCSCCVDIEFTMLNASENVCQNLTYNPVNLSTNVNILINGRSFFKGIVSGTDSTPMCIPFPPALPIMSLCIYVDRIQFKNGGFQICPSTELLIFNKRAFRIHFDCVRLDVTGIILGMLDIPNVSVPSLPHFPNISVPSLPHFPNISVPTLPKIAVPIIRPTVPGVPNISVPIVRPSVPGVPNISVPTVRPTVPEVPNISVPIVRPTVPGVPNISVPTVRPIVPGVPNISVPIVRPTVPGVPNIAVPTVRPIVPAVPNIAVPTTPGVSSITVPTVPGVPNITVPKVPGTPNTSIPTISGVPRISG